MIGEKKKFIAPKKKKKENNGSNFNQNYTHNVV